MFSIGITRLSKLRSNTTSFDVTTAVESYSNVLCAIRNQGSSIEIVRKTLTALAVYFRFDALALWQANEDKSTLSCIHVYAGYDCPEEVKSFLRNPRSTNRQEGIAKVFDRQEPMLLNTNQLHPVIAKEMKLAFLVPVACDDQSVGVLEIFVKEKYEFNNIVRTFLQNIGLQLGEKLYRKQLETCKCTDMHSNPPLNASRADQEEEKASKGRALIALMAHDIKAPVCASSLLIEMLLKGRVGVLSDEQRGLVNLIDFNNREILRLIKEALHSQQFRAGEDRPVHLTQVLESCATEVVQELKNKEISLTTSIGTSEPIISGDELAIKHVLLNILHNAIKFSDTNTTIHTSITDGENDSFVVSIEDKGRGMTADEQSRLFKPFSKSDGGESLLDGDGLGLYLSRLIVLQHGGDIKVNSEPKKGSSFLVVLPKPQASAASA